MIAKAPFARTAAHVNNPLMTLHLIKLCVGCDTVEELVAWHKARPQSGGLARDWRVHTRQTPKRAAELTDGGSLFRVFKGLVLCRQQILEVQTVGEGQAARCEIVLDPTIVRVAPTPRRAFQGWRYLTAEDAPADLSSAGDMDAAPPALVARLREIGAW